MLCNLSKNMTQTRITLDVTFKCFVEAGEHTDLDCTENNIYFLAYTKHNKLRLYKICVKPWLKMEDEVSISSEPKMDIDLGNFTFQQVKKA